MGHRANFVLIRSGKAQAFYDQWAAMGCVHQFAAGPDAAVGALEAFEPATELMDWAFAEGGYLIDFDRKEAIVFGPSGAEFGLEDFEELEDFASPEEIVEASALEQALASGPEAFLEAVKPHWQGWLLHWDDRGVDAFAAHLGERGIHSITTQPPHEPASTNVCSLQA